MRRSVKAAILVAVGLILAFPLFSLTYYTMTRTSTPGFCASCHEIEFAYNTWRTSSHANNPYGFVADCMDCHLPRPTTPSTSSTPRPSTASRTSWSTSPWMNTTGRKTGRRLMPPSPTTSARSATGTCSTFRKNGAPCWLTGASFTPGPATRKSAWTAIGTSSTPSAITTATPSFGSRIGATEFSNSPKTVEP